MVKNTYRERINLDIKNSWFKQTGLMSKKHKIIWTLSYEHFLILASAVTGHISISAFASLVRMSLGSTSSVVRLKC